jgi:hypothetical protein
LEVTTLTLKHYKRVIIPPRRRKAAPPLKSTRSLINTAS